MKVTSLLRQATGVNPTTPFSAAHKAYVQSLYRRYLRNELDWCIRRDVWRDRAIEIRTQFEHNRHIANPRELAKVLQAAEEALTERRHPDPYKRECDSKGFRASKIGRCDSSATFARRFLRGTLVLRHEHSH